MAPNQWNSIVQAGMVRMFAGAGGSGRHIAGAGGNSKKSSGSGIKKTAQHRDLLHTFKSFTEDGRPCSVS